MVYKICIFYYICKQENKMNDVFAERLKNARIMKGYSMDDLVKELGNCVTKTAIMKYEKGIMKPNSSLIISLSNVLNQPVDYFFRPFSFCIDSISFRKKSSLSIKEENAIKEKVGDLIERYVYIEEMCNSFIPLCPVKCELISNKEQVKSISEEMRDRWNLGEDGIINVIELLEGKGAKILELDATESFDGLSATVNGYIPVIILNAKKSSEKKRFTALHELGHAILTFDPGLSDKIVEELCSYFASEMLLPERVFKKKIGEKRSLISYPELAALQARYGISCDALMYKAYIYGIISQQKYKAFCASKKNDERTKELTERSIFPQEESHRFSSLVYKALCNDLITTSKAAALLNVPVSDIREQIAFI